MKQLNFSKQENNRRWDMLTFQKHLKDGFVMVISDCRLLKLNMKKARKLYKWLGRAFEEYDRKKPHNFKEGDKVRVWEVVRRYNKTGCNVSKKYIYGVVSPYPDRTSYVEIGKPKEKWELHDRRVFVKFDTKEPMTCPLCHRPCGQKTGMRCNPDELELV